MKSLEASNGALRLKGIGIGIRYTQIMMLQSGRGVVEGFFYGL
jgi:hypothetical protein